MSSPSEPVLELPVKVLLSTVIDPRATSPPPPPVPAVLPLKVLFVIVRAPMLYPLSNRPPPRPDPPAVLSAKVVRSIWVGPSA